MLVGWTLVQRAGIFDGEWDAVEHNFRICGQGSSAACVVDGDTIRIGQRRIRIVGLDAPELNGACEAERRLAQTAREELAGWLNRGAFEMSSDADMTRDQYGRELRALRRGSRDVADVMVSRGLARRDRWDRDWCA